jgi:hypothetical protein
LKGDKLHTDIRDGVGFERQGICSIAGDPLRRVRVR